MLQDLDGSEPSLPVQTSPKNNASTGSNFPTPTNNAEFKEPSESNALQIFENRKAPEGKDNDSIVENHVMESKDLIDVNGKVTVHVVVTINGNGTLADLKKQRMQIRNSSSDANSVTSPLGSITDDSNVSPIADIHRFTGEATEENVGYAKSKRCCIIL